jgi:hypothetical protein
MTAALPDWPAAMDKAAHCLTPAREQENDNG